MRSAFAPIGRNSVKSNPVPFTGAFFVGMRPAVVWVYSSAKIFSSWFSTLPLDSPARFQYEWCVRFSTVGLSVVAS